MASRTIHIPIPTKARDLALRGPFHDGPGQLSLLPDTRAALEHATLSPLGVPFVDGDFSPEQARDLFDYFRSAADTLTTLGTDGAVECAQAYDNARHALRMAGIPPV